VDYVFRVKAKAVFDALESSSSYVVMDFFVVEDQKFDEYFMIENLWRETLLLHKFYKDYLLGIVKAQENMTAPPVLRVIKVKQFGQMPNKVIFREIEECSGITLEEYLQTLQSL
jgi:hypothetical protein